MKSYCSDILHLKQLVAEQYELIDEELPDERDICSGMQNEKGVSRTYYKPVPFNLSGVISF